MALAHFEDARVLTPERAIQVGPLDDCRSVAVSPDGELLATGNHQVGGVRIWRIHDAAEVAKLPIDSGTGVTFSPDGKLLMSTAPPCRLWTVGTWREARQISGRGLCFSPDGRLVAVDGSEQSHPPGRDGERPRSRATRKPRPLRRGLRDVQPRRFAAGCDQQRPTSGAPVGPAAIRRKLAPMGLDWDAPSYPEIESASANAPPTPLKAVVDMGALDGELRSLLDQALKLQHEGKIAEAIAVLREASRKWPNDATVHNNIAWLLVTSPESLAKPDRGSRTCATSRPTDAGGTGHLNTLGVALYRAGEFAEAITTLEQSLAVGKGQFDAFDLFFLAMAHHRLGHRIEARALPLTAQCAGWNRKKTWQPNTLPTWRHFASKPRRC